jgi:hypothetical protein
VLEFLVDFFSDGIWRDLNRWMGRFIRSTPLRILACVLTLILMTAAVAGLVALLIFGITAAWNALR